VFQEPIEAGRRGGDPVVVAALALGWEMADLYAAREVDGPTRELPETLPGVRGLSHRQTVHATLLRIRALIRQALGPAVSDTITLPSAQVLGELPEGDQPAWGQALYDLHVQISGALRASGDAPMHAYDAGGGGGGGGARPHILQHSWKHPHPPRSSSASTSPASGR
jgi:hypothetical protein